MAIKKLLNLSERLNSHDNLYTNLLYHKFRRLRMKFRSRQAAYSTVSLRLCFAVVSCLMGCHQNKKTTARTVVCKNNIYIILPQEGKGYEEN